MKVAIVKRIATVVVALVTILYAGDLLSVKFRRDPLSVVQINKIYAVPQKGGKTEFDAGEPEPETCVNSIFPHLGYSRCWYVNRHSEPAGELPTECRTRLGMRLDGTRDRRCLSDRTNPDRGKSAQSR